MLQDVSKTKGGNTGNQEKENRGQKAMEMEGRKPEL